MTLRINGVLTFHSETGTEGGHWAIQDANYIRPNTTQFRCQNCNLIHEKGRPKPTHTCTKRVHSWVLWPDTMWSYEGLHILKDGDILRVYDHYGKAKWEGMINLRHHPLFTESVFGMWIHADQTGANREWWATLFFNELSATLIREG